MQDAFGYDPKYVMGRSTAETDRLKRHSQLYDASTWQLFKEAGIWEGMKDLDVESGTGGSVDSGRARANQQPLGGVGRLATVGVTPVLDRVDRVRRQGEGPIGWD